MADERDPNLSRHYRSLEPLEPPAELDRRIVDAAHAAASPHAPLVTPAGRHRWYYGLAAAAVLVFAVALTLHMERERPDPEAVALGVPLRLDRELRGQIKPAPEPAAKPSAPAREEQRFAPDPQTARPARGDVDRARQERFAAERATADAEAKQAQALAAEARLQSQSGAAQRSAAAPSAARAAAAPESPERWLERIAELRSRGRHADADRELAAFRRAYPDYRLSDVMRERVEGTPTPSR